jgi:hypothetical protein
MALIDDPISAVAGAVQSIVERVCPDPNQQLQAKVQIAQMYLNGDLQKLTTQAGVISAEASSSNKLASSWRPMLMYIFMAIIANNYILAPYLGAMFHIGIQLSIPPDMWDLLKLGVGGYVVGRSIEKTTSALTGRPATTAIKSAVSNIFSGS